MNRYVVKNGKDWKVVNAGYKRSIRNFPTQQKAIDFARDLIGTDSLFVQGRDRKFIRHFGAKQHEGNEISCDAMPKFVMKHSDEYEEYLKNYRIKMLAYFGMIMTVLGLVLMMFWLVERAK